MLEGDRIVINKPFSEVVAFSPYLYPDGFFVLPGNLPYPTLAEMGYERTCVFGYNVTWNREDGTSIARNCLQSEPTWMWDNREQLANIRVGDLVLTGAHDAGAYRQISSVTHQNCSLQTPERHNDWHHAVAMHFNKSIKRHSAFLWHKYESCVERR